MYYEEPKAISGTVGPKLEKLYTLLWQLELNFCVQVG